MEKNTICKTVHQYNKEPIPAYEMKKLQEIAKDYRSIKNYVYERFGGIQSLKVIYPGYTVQKKMTDSGLRKNLRGGGTVRIFLSGSYGCRGGYQKPVDKDKSEDIRLGQP